jgi:hypothetical protein
MLISPRLFPGFALVQSSAHAKGEYQVICDDSKKASFLMHTLNPATVYCHSNVLLVRLSDLVSPEGAITHFWPSFGLYPPAYLPNSPARRSVPVDHKSINWACSRAPPVSHPGASTYPPSVYSMLIVKASSSCDVCLEPFQLRAESSPVVRAPCAIDCGHIFCSTYVRASDVQPLTILKLS